MRLACVHCGERSHAEFSYLGDAGPRRPADGRDGAAMFDYVYLRDNPPGVLSELWQHVGGCRAWMVVERNISTHAIVAVRAANSGSGAASSGAARGSAAGGRIAARAEEAIR